MAQWLFKTSFEVFWSQMGRKTQSKAQVFQVDGKGVYGTTWHKSSNQSQEGPHNPCLSCGFSEVSSEGALQMSRDELC